MRKELFLIAMVLMVLTSCSKKLQPVGTKAANSPPPANTTSKEDTKPVAPVISVPELLPAAVVKLAKPMIVIDEAGTIITSRDKLPASVADKVDYRKISRSFTPEQRQNLIYRFKIVPPRVLFVPDHLASKTTRGYYCVYKKKFWYWKKEDGLFHLDETYYQ